MRTRNTGLLKSTPARLNRGLTGSQLPAKFLQRVARLNRIPVTAVRRLLGMVPLELAYLGSAQDVSGDQDDTS